MPTDENKRTFTRVDARIYFGYSRLSHGPQHWEKTARLHLSRGSEEIPACVDISEASGMLRLIYAALAEVKEDLQLIKAHLGIEEAFLQRQKMQLSGSGLSFDGNVTFRSGQLLLLSLVLPFELPILIRAVGEIVDGGGQPSHGKLLNRLKFVVIHEEDRELIVKYTFQRQRELINISNTQRKADGVI